MRVWATLAMVVFIGSAAAMQVAQAQTVYKWVDENGAVQFSDRPPVSAQAEEIELEMPTAQPAEPAGTEVSSSDPSAFVLAGRWRNTEPDQIIVMTLQAGGGSRWQVTYQGQNWSDLTGKWEADDSSLTLTNQLGRTDYGLTVLSEDEIQLTDGQLGAAMIFTR